MNTANAAQMTKALSERGITSIVVASGSGEILIATAKARLHSSEKVKTILPSAANFDGEKWATTYEGQYITDPAEIARLRDDAKSNSETAIRLGKIEGKGDSQKVFLKSGPVVTMDKKAISEYMKGLDKQDKVRKDQAPDTKKPEGPKVKQQESEAGKKTASNVAKRERASVSQEKGDVGSKVEKTVKKNTDPKVSKGKKIREDAPAPGSVKHE